MAAPPAAGVAHVVVEDDVPVARGSGPRACHPGPTARTVTRGSRGKVPWARICSPLLNCAAASIGEALQGPSLPYCNPRRRLELSMPAGGPTAYLSTRIHDTWRRAGSSGDDEQARVR
jgi:hypothetical protein